MAWGCSRFQVCLARPNCAACRAATQAHDAYGAVGLGLRHLSPAFILVIVLQGGHVALHGSMDAPCAGQCPSPPLLCAALQGGHVAYKVVLTHPEPLAGCAAMSTWLEPSLKDVSRPHSTPSAWPNYSRANQCRHGHMPTRQPARTPSIQLPATQLPARPPAAPPIMQVPPANLALPFFVGHGSVDNLIPPAIASTTQDVLEGLGCTAVEFHM